MTTKDLLAARRSLLEAVIRASAGDKPHLDAFVARLFGPDRASELMPTFRFVCPDALEAIRCEGFPRIAHVGFGLASGVLNPSDVGDIFLGGIARLQQRQGQMLQSLASDDAALLGLCEGVAYLTNAGYVVMEGVRNWLVQMVDSAHGQGDWLARVRSLAGDVLDSRGRLRAMPAREDTDTRALEFALHAAWPDAFTGFHGLDDEGRAQILASLLSDPPPCTGDLERAAVWLRAIDALVSYAARSLTPSLPDIVRILRAVQHSFKRWRLADRPRRRGVRPGVWLIDDEYDVQTLLWAILYPIFGPDLVDETHLPNWGFTEPRFDLGIGSLGLIIEVKIARTPTDFSKIEGEIGSDLGLYFKEPSKFDRMIVFIYDDCDRHEPEKIDGLEDRWVEERAHQEGPNRGYGRGAQTERNARSQGPTMTRIAE